MTSPRPLALIISFIHYSLIIAVLGALLTGLRILTVKAPIGALGIWTYIIPQGSVYLWHGIFAGLLCLTFFAYLYILLAYKRYRLFIPTKAASNDTHAPQNKSANSNKALAFIFLQLSVWLALALLSGAIITGSLQFFSVYAGNYEKLNKIHQLFAWALLGFFIVHALIALVAKGIPAVFSIFTPKLGDHKLVLATTSLAVALALSFIYIFIPKQLQQELVIHALSDKPDGLTSEGASESIQLDGEASDSIWKHIRAVHVTTVGGSSLENGQVTVSVKAAHDHKHAYFLFRWPDASRSLKHTPLIKTEEGWRIMQSGLLNADETGFYEDKFAVMLSRSDEIAGAGTLKLGHRPLKHHPRPIGQRGLHYTDDGSVTDVWQWKAVRTGFSLGQADDNHFGAALPSDSEFKRYTGGYQRDDDCEHLVRWEAGDYQLKPECGGYISNWKLLKEGIVQPRRLPKNLNAVKHIDKLDLRHNSSDRGKWWMDWQDSQVYSADSDTLPLGSVIPSVLSLGPFKQGRGDVSAAASWRDGYWSLEIKRSLSSNSKYDLPIEDGIFFWLAVFNHSQTRHSYHLHPLKIKMN
ncbi:ethylbenzene dehydrogenase-related protein [Agaribacterium haliotis]|uniref:ethylbenzene dehydrogenase-related protein n=1 Tax=Agaribacterium haliotis TaxID=2013869 RepID=UPI001303F8F7|nr:ethylbenzene dehydrogenase-related protein [Agaribacterium haliotis]